MRTSDAEPSPSRVAATEERAGTSGRGARAVELVGERIGAGLLHLDAEGRIAYANRLFCRLTGYGLDELRGRPLLALLEPANPPPACESGAGEREALLVGKDGGRRWLRFVSTPWLDGEARPAGSLELCFDAGDRLAARDREAALQQQVRNVATEWTATFDAVDSPTLLLDGDGVVLRLNRAARDAAGGDYRDLLGRRIERFAPGEPWSTAGDAVRRLRQGGEPLELHVADEATGKTWVLAASAVDLPELDAARVVLVARDVTRLVALERSLRRTEVLSAMGSLVAGVAQEVRRPLFAMAATVDAVDACFGGRDEDLARSVEVLRNEIGSLRDLMQNLLELGRPARPDRVPASVAELLADARSACELAIGGAGVELVEELPPDLPTVTVDRQAVVQALRNLLENAVRHGPVEGRVVVSASAAGGWVECAVRDDGPGFPPDALAAAFEPFSPRRGLGVGLGLAIVQHVVEEHGGEVAARNLPDGGAEVSIRLPATPRPAD